MTIKKIQLLTNLKMAIEDAPLYEEKEFEKRLEDIIAKLYWELCISKWDKEDSMINAGFEEHKTNEELDEEKNDYHPHWSEIQ